MPHIAVVDPGVHTPEVACFEHMAAGSPVPLTYHLPALRGFASLAAEPEPIGIVVVGSASSVHDRLPWQRELGDWLLPRMRRGTPTLGACFGHQLIAHLLGARVEYLTADRAKREGFEDTALAANPLWGDACTVPLYVSHREVVTSCPDELIVVATRPGLACDGFAHRALPVWTLQAHPEATAGFGRGIVGAPAQFAPGHRVVEAFLHLAARRAL